MSDATSEMMRQSLTNRREYIFNINPISIDKALGRRERTGFYEPHVHNKIVMGIEFRNQHAAQGKDTPYTMPLLAHIQFYVNDHAGLPKRKKTDYWHYTLPDLTRLTEFLFNVAHDSEIIADKRIIASIISTKIIDRYHPRTHLILQELPR